jgi:hypothetical protein
VTVFLFRDVWEECSYNVAIAKHFVALVSFRSFRSFRRFALRERILLFCYMGERLCVCVCRKISFNIVFTGLLVCFDCALMGAEEVHLRDEWMQTYVRSCLDDERAMWYFH